MWRWTIGILICCFLGGFSNPALAACDNSHFRWAASTHTLYIKGPAICEPREIHSQYPDILEQIDSAAGIWLLHANLHLEAGATLNIKGQEKGGTVGSFRLASPGPWGNVRIRADWGNIVIDGTQITSWDPASNQPDINSADGRAYIQVRSRLGDDGTPQESRMDILDSEVQYLGYAAAEAYGLSWKVADGAFDQVNVVGDIRDSQIHDNYMGMYSYGAYGMTIARNEFAFNESFGIDPHDDSDHLLITENYVHDNGNHGILCSRRCDHLTITDNRVARNLHGIMLHRDINDSLIEANQVYDNLDTGIVLLESHHNTVRNNTLLRNRHGIRLSLGSHDNLISANTLTDNTENALFLFHGSDPAETTLGRPENNLFSDNIVTGSTFAIKAADADRNLFTHNHFNGATQFRFLRSIDNELHNNQYTQTAQLEIKGDANLATNLQLSNEHNHFQLHIDTRSVAVLEDEDGYVYQLQLQQPATSISPTASHLELTHDVTGDAVELVFTGLAIAPQTGTLRTHAIMANQDDYHWTLSTGPETGETEFCFAGLTANLEFALWRTEQRIKTAYSDASGFLCLTDRPEPARELRYALSPYRDANGKPMRPPTVISSNSGVATINKDAGGGGASDALMFLLLLGLKIRQRN